jgi:hypothetical protein
VEVKEESLDELSAISSADETPYVFSDFPETTEETPEFDAAGIPTAEWPAGVDNSDTVIQAGGFTEPVYVDRQEIPPTEDPGKLIDEEIPPQRRDSEKPTKTAAKAGPPTLAEWEDFFARVLFRTLTEWYVSFAFRGIPDDVIDDEDLRKLVLSRDERKEIAAPLASLANKSQFARKQGRRVIAAVDSMEAIVILGMWMAKVNRTAAKYKPAKGRAANVHSSPPPENGRGNTEYIPPENIRINNPGFG